MRATPWSPITRRGAPSPSCGRHRVHDCVATCAPARESEERVNSAFNQNSNGVSVVGVAGPALVAEPPLSPPPTPASVPQPAPAPQEPAPVLEVAPAPAPVVAVAPAPIAPAPPAPAEPEAPAGLPLEGLLLRFGLITTEQLTEAMRERTATGKDIGAIVVERGWVDAAQLARVSSYSPAFEPEPEPSAKPAPEPEPQPVATPEPVAAPPAAHAGQRVKVFVRLTSGERVDAGTFDGLDGAKARGAEIAR